ncbi:MAG: hypothetical protein ACLPXB_05265 [Thiobacillaceae bacterium]
MHLPFRSNFYRALAALCLLVAGLTGYAETASASAPDPRIYGAWMLVDAEHVENRGMWSFFSPDGNFFMVDPKTQLGMVGNWSMGRAGLLVNIMGNNQWGKLWDADVSFQDDNHMVLDVKESQFSPPHRVILQRIKFSLPRSVMPPVDK